MAIAENTATSSSVCEKKPRVLRVNSSVHALASVQVGSGHFSEQWLQSLIFEHPDCLPVREIEPAFGELVSAGMEIATRHGPIDNLLLTADGQIVLVEAKLWRNPQARREVVAQALDYASCLFDWEYEELEERVLKASFGTRPKPKSLYALFEGNERLSLSRFVDAVNENLRRGRILILVVGDGIRTEARRLANLVQSHVGAHFTFALVELNVFEVDGPQDVLIVPRVLAQTEMISRGVVDIVDGRIEIANPAQSLQKQVPEALPSVLGNISADEFYEAMGRLNTDLPQKLKAFLENLGAFGVWADFQRSLNLRWEPPSGRTINLGVIHRDGQVWTDVVNARAPQQFAHGYNEELASKLGFEVDKQSFREGAWHVRQDGRAPRITAIADRLNVWGEVIGHFIDAMRNSAEE